MSRYFVAVVPEGLVENPALKQLVGKMKRTLSDREREVRWVAPILWHVTLQFLGELNVRVGFAGKHGQVPAAAAALAQWN